MIILTLEEAKAYIARRCTHGVVTPHQKEKLKIALAIVANSWTTPAD
jgi:hypothetical protein